MKVSTKVTHVVCFLNRFIAAHSAYMANKIASELSRMKKGKCLILRLGEFQELHPNARLERWL